MISFSINMADDLVDKIEEELKKNSTFRNRSHLIECAVRNLMEEKK